MDLPKYKDGHYEIRDYSQNKILQHQKGSKIHGNILTTLQQIWKTQIQHYRIK